MEEFTLKTVTFKNKTGDIVVHKNKNSNGHSSIQLYIVEKIAFNFSSEGGLLYKEKVEQVVELLNKALEKQIDLN